MNNYPDGVTDADIDAHFGGARDDWPFVLECDHERKAEELADERGIDTEEVHDFDGKPTMFKDNEVDELSSWATGWGAQCEWKCPVCGQVNEEEVDADDFGD